jgi:hypothetical protein
VGAIAESNCRLSEELRQCTPVLATSQNAIAQAALAGAKPRTQPAGTARLRQRGASPAVVYGQRLL